jgi:hypothetical protein
MANIATGLEKIGDIAETLNDIILNTGKKIDINNRTIWDEFLHRYDNTDWEDMLAGFNAIIESHPDAVKAYHKNNYAKAQATLKKGHSQSDRVLDKKGNKTTAWAMIHTFREVWNALHDKDIPNEDAKVTARKAQRPKVVIEHTEDYVRTTMYHNLFEEE